MPLPARLVVASVALAVAGAPACRRDNAHPPHRAPALVPVAPTAPLPLTPPSNTQVLLPSGQSIADVAERVTPSVVNVFSERELPQAQSFDPFGGIVKAPRRHALSLGSGVIVSSDGVIVTNHHVVMQSEAIAVVLKDGRELRATLIGSDPKSDVAVLRVDAHGLPAITIADSSRLRVGDLVLAIGNPFGIGQTVTMGIISATGRANLGITDVEDFIQTDAAINPGNSGGALIDMGGKLVGINTAIASRSGGYQGIGFAIPSNIVVQVEDQLVRHGKVTRGWLGVAIQDAARSAGAGVVVTAVTPTGPAARAGIARGDVITSIGGAHVADAAHLRNVVALAGPGRVRVEVQRNGKLFTRDVELSEEPASEHDAKDGDAKDGDGGDGELEEP